ncbi:uncharacterized protein ACNLHF_008972 isoform 2-T2 [Anomaloglossus baeobatrachus]
MKFLLLLLFGTFMTSALGDLPTDPKHGFLNKFRNLFNHSKDPEHGFLNKLKKTFKHSKDRTKRNENPESIYYISEDVLTNQSEITHNSLSTHKENITLQQPITPVWRTTLSNEDKFEDMIRRNFTQLESAIKYLRSLNIMIIVVVTVTVCLSFIGTALSVYLYITFCTGKSFQKYRVYRK